MRSLDIRALRTAVNWHPEIRPYAPEVGAASGRVGSEEGLPYPQVVERLPGTPVSAHAVRDAAARSPGLVGGCL